MDREPTASTTTSARPRHARRPRLHLLYYCLAAFDLLTVSLSLYLIDRVARIYTNSVVVNQEWASRLEDFAELARLASAVNSPGNDLFQSREVERERERFREARRTFVQRRDAVHAALMREVGHEGVAGVLAAFPAIDATMSNMVASAESLFGAFEAGDQTLAGEHMAAMDRHYAAMNDHLTDLSDRIREIQRTHIAGELERAGSIRRAEWIVAGLILVMIVGVTFYGHRLAIMMRRDVERIEEAVETRTRELQHSHARLRHAERLAAIGTLAAGVGHDMNNVLFPVRCRLDALSDDADSSTKEDIQAIRSGVIYLQQLSDGLRLLASDPDREARREELHLDTWWRTVEPLFRAALRREIELVTDPANLAGLPPISMPVHHLTQAVFNLVTNAGEAIQGPGRVTIAAASGDGMVRIEVRDTGPGMSPEVRQHAFDPFFTTKKRTVATGLGLALVHALVKRHGGIATIESEPGHGVTVQLDLPMARLASPDDQRAQGPMACISVADDRIRGLAAAVLTAHGFKCRMDAEPGHADVWVCDEEAGLGRVDAFLAGAAGRHVIQVAAESNADAPPGVVLVSRESLLDGLRSAAARAAADFSRQESGT